MQTRKKNCLFHSRINRAKLRTCVNKNKKSNSDFRHLAVIGNLTKNNSRGYSNLWYGPSNMTIMHAIALC